MTVVDDGTFQGILSQWDKIPLFSLTRPTYIEVTPPGWNVCDFPDFTSYGGIDTYANHVNAEQQSAHENWYDLTLPWDQRRLTTDPNPADSWTSAPVDSGGNYVIASSANNWIGVVGWIFSPVAPVSISTVITDNIAIYAELITQNKISSYIQPIYESSVTLTGYVSNGFGWAETCGTDSRYNFGGNGKCDFPIVSVGSSLSQTDYEEVANQTIVDGRPCDYPQNPNPGTNPNLLGLLNYTPEPGSNRLLGYIFTNKFLETSMYQNNMNLFPKLQRFAGDYFNGVNSDITIPDSMLDIVTNAQNKYLNTTYNSCVNDSCTMSNQNITSLMRSDFTSVTPCNSMINPTPYLINRLSTPNQLGVILSHTFIFGSLSNKQPVLTNYLNPEPLTSVATYPTANYNYGTNTGRVGGSSQITISLDFFKTAFRDRLSACLSENTNPSCSVLIGYGGSQFWGISLPRGQADNLGVGSTAIGDYLNVDDGLEFSTICSTNFYGPWLSGSGEATTNGTCAIVASMCPFRDAPWDNVSSTVNRFCQNTYLESSNCTQADKDGNQCSTGKPCITTCGAMEIDGAGTGPAYFTINGNLSNGSTDNLDLLSAQGATGNKLCANAAKASFVLNTPNKDIISVQGSQCVIVEQIYPQCAVKSETACSTVSKASPNIVRLSPDTAIVDARDTIITCVIDNPTPSQRVILNKQTMPTKIGGKFNHLNQPICRCSDGAAGTLAQQMISDGASADGIQQLLFSGDCKYDLLSGCGKDDSSWAFRPDPSSIDSCTVQICNQSINISDDVANCNSDIQTCFNISNIKNVCKFNDNSYKCDPITLECVLNSDGTETKENCQNNCNSSTPQPPDQSNKYVCNQESMMCETSTQGSMDWNVCLQSCVPAANKPKKNTTFYLILAGIVIIIIILVILAIKLFKSKPT